LEKLRTVSNGEKILMFYPERSIMRNLTSKRDSFQILSTW